MANVKTYSGITEAIFECIKFKSEAEDGIIHTPGNQGTVTINTIIGQIFLEFQLDTSQEKLDYKILKKPLIAPANRIWDQVDQLIKYCQTNSL
ncbi:hypothetical protein VB638_07905 [Dolichospermum sp. UHCC 0684]|uniref:hypothetical protein n=1 Tax=unclassified Dolichospermum TaxID=2622029 RepID=UPI0014479E64|nr:MULTISPECIES: hypothetical protein [unclassified Dolichospermum]MEA5529512.1 hypothetical protein [Dolichospermum sp. UHCC 0684]MTJ36283.1 hypothetical protein [Dolichospermum sp. UHCC 0260]